MQIIFQDPVGSLNPRMPVSDIIGEGLLAQADKENGWGDAASATSASATTSRSSACAATTPRRYPHEFSGGQRQRIGIARALALDTRVHRLRRAGVRARRVDPAPDPQPAASTCVKSSDSTYLFIAHNLSVVQYISDRVGVMYLGKIVELAPVDKLYAKPRHPYTVALLSAVPEPDPAAAQAAHRARAATCPAAANPPSGCRFRTRCWLFEQLGRPDICIDEEPELKPLGGGQFAACHWSGQDHGRLGRRGGAQPAAGHDRHGHGR